MCAHTRLTLTISGGIYNASIPFILVACKCDFPSTHRHVDPVTVEKRAKALIGDITAFQTSKSQPDSQKRCVAVLLRAIVSMRNRKCLLLPTRSLILQEISRLVGFRCVSAVAAAWHMQGDAPWALDRNLGLDQQFRPRLLSIT